MRTLFLLATLALCPPAVTLADTPLDAARFDAYVTGRTLGYGAPGSPSYGVEQYLPNRRVIWSVRPGECLHGVWFESKGDICFRYQNNTEPQCWTVYADPDGLRAIYTNNPNTTMLFEARDDTPPLICNDLNS